MAWEQTESNTLDSLLAVAGWDPEQREKNGTPWREGDLVEFRGIGGMEVRGARHEVVAGARAYTKVSGDRDLVVNGDMRVNVHRGNLMLTAADSKPDAIDSLTVHGHMHSESGKTRTTIGTGRVDRMYHGPHVKIAGMEGIICAGAWSRTYTTSYMTLAGLKMGDVFGGAVMASGTRTHISSVLYRSVEYSHWDMGTYTRNVQSCIQPIVGSAAPVDGKWARRRDIAQKIAFTIMPVLGMLYGIVMLPVALFGLAKLGYGLATGKKSTAPAGPTRPRTHVRTIGGAEVDVMSSEVII